MRAQVLVSGLSATSLDTTGSPGATSGLAEAVGRLTRRVRLPSGLRMMLRWV